VGPLARGWRWCRRNPLLAVLTGSVAALLVAVAAVASVAALWLGHERDQALDHLERAERAEKDALDKLWGSYLAQARAGRWSGQAGRRFDSLDALARAAALRPAVELRNEAVACLALADLRPARTFAAAEGRVAFDPSHALYATWDEAGNVVVRRTADGGEVRAIAGPGNPLWVVRFSPRGTYLAAKSHPILKDRANKLHVWEVATGREVLATTGLSQGAMDFSPDERFLAMVHAERSVRFYELPSGRGARTFPLEVMAHQLRFDPKGERIALSSMVGTGVEVRQAADGRLLHRFAVNVGLRGVAWHPEGDLLAAGGNDFKVYLLRPGGEAVQALEGHSGTVVEVAFNPGGDLLASYAWGGTLKLWDPRAGKELVTVPGWHARTFPALHFGTDDRTLGHSLAGDRVMLWEAAAGRECRALPVEHGPGRNLWSAAPSPDGRLAVLARADGLHLWDAGGGRELARLNAGHTRSAFFHPRGEALYSWEIAGLYRWPLARREDGTVEKVGPRERLKVMGSPLIEYAALSADGRLFAAGDRLRSVAFVFDLGAGKTVMEVPHDDPSRIAIRDDGRLLAGAMWGSAAPKVRVWEVPSGKVAVELEGESGAIPAFSPDGRWLVVSRRDGYHFWATADWKAGKHLPTEGKVIGGIAFSPDGKLLAINPGTGVVQLRDARTLAELASFPGGSPEAFSADGATLLTKEDRQVQAWDLRAVRRGLRAADLDWPQEGYATAPEPAPHPPITVARPGR
jgi:WD40 repeat protein